MRFLFLLLICGLLAATNQVKNEKPGGVPDGSLQFFTVKQSPVPTSVQLYRNGVRQSPGVDFATYPSTKRIGFFPCCIPQPGDLLLIDYEY
jgi:hypothetical protein